MMDYAIRGGTVVDGTRRAPYAASVYIKDGRIGAITSNSLEALQEFDASGLIIAPGFIDMHSHSDIDSLPGEARESKLVQGVTLELAGSCGYSGFPLNGNNRTELLQTYQIRPELQQVKRFRDYKAIVDRDGYPTHFMCQIGHGSLRGYVMGLEARTPNHQEMEQMCTLLDEELKDGAAGLSLGLIYPPGSFCQTEELVQLARVAEKNGKFVSVHMRNEGERIFEAVEEMLHIAQETGVRLQISHLKLMGTPQWGQAPRLLELLDNARLQGIQLNCDQYPYTATSTKLAQLLPKSAHSGGNDKMIEHLRTESGSLREYAKAAIATRGGSHGIVISTTCGAVPSAEGKSLADLAAEQGTNPVDAAFQLLIDANGNVNCIYHCISPADMELIIRDMHTAVGSDGSALSYDRAMRPFSPHPRNYGTFPRFLQTVRDRNLLSLEDAVYKMTGLSAQILGLPDRGTLKVGNRADLTVFNWQQVQDHSTYTDALVKPAGIRAVWIDGSPALLEDQVQAMTLGKML